MNIFTQMLNDEMEMMSEEGLLERFKVIASSYSDFLKYELLCYELVEKIDETHEYYDFNSWLNQSDDAIACAMNGIGQAENALYELVEDAEEIMWQMFDYIKEYRKELFISIFKFNPDDIDTKSIREYIDNNSWFIEMDKAYVIEDNYNNIVDTIKNAFFTLKSEKFEYNERPFFNDNFAVLKIMIDNQTTIKNQKYVLLSQRDISTISGFNLNKIQNIVSMLIKWGYISAPEKGKYQITTTGKTIMDSLLKVPITKVIK